MTLLRSELLRWTLLSLVVLVLGLVGVVRTPGTDATTTGRIAGFGFRLDGGECYLNVAYRVRGRSFRLTSSHDRRWCGYRDLYRSQDDVVVYYDSSDPGRATLVPRDRLPMAATVVGLAGLAACGAVGARRRRPEPAALSR